MPVALADHAACLVLKTPTRPAILPAAQALPEAYFFVGGGGFVPPTPLAIADFKNGVYSIDGVSKTFAEMFVEDEAQFSTFDPATLIPGTGIQVSGTGAVLNGLLSTAELAAALSLPSGLTIVADYTLERTGTRNPQVTVELIDLPDYALEWAFVHGTGVNKYWIDDYLGVSYYEDGLVGTYKTAMTLSPTILEYQHHGGELETAVGNPVDIPGCNTVGIATNIGGTAGGTATATLRSLVFYAPQPGSSFVDLVAP